MPVRSESRITPATLVDYLVRERVRNEKLGAPYQERLDLLRGLVRQVPHRVYFNGDGELMRAIFFKGNYPNEAFVDVISPGRDNWEERKSEYMIGRTSRDVEDQIKFLRSRYGMKHDLLTQPTQVYEIESDTSERTYIHVGDQNLAVCEYHTTYLFGFTPRFVSFHPSDLARHDPNKLVQLSTPPTEIVDYSLKPAPGS